MIKPKSQKEIKMLREGGKRLAHILQTVKQKSVPGTTLPELDEFAVQALKEFGEDPDKSAAFFKYQPQGAPRPYPAHICVSLNEEIVHGIPGEYDGDTPPTLKEGDLVSLDMGLLHKELITDSAITFVVGEADEEQNALMAAAQDALSAGIEAATVGARAGDVSAAIQASVEESDLGNFSIYKELVGHGVGYLVHEDPYVPNIGMAGTGAKLPTGAVIAIEPMIGVGGSEIELANDGYTYKTKDGSLSAHFEHSVAITEDGPQILTAA